MRTIFPKVKKSFGRRVTTVLFSFFFSCQYSLAGPLDVSFLSSVHPCVREAIL